MFKNRMSTGISNQRHKKLAIVIAGAGSFIFYFLIVVLATEKPVSYANEMKDAAKIMETALSVIKEYCEKTGIEIDEMNDPNQTGLIGPELSGLTTTLGHLDAKRTTTNPDMAGLLVHLLHQADVVSGDTVAIGSSASFPALLIASLAASKAMRIHPRIIISLGSSSYGATKTNFDLLDIYHVLIENKVFSVKPVAVSLGGEKDIGATFEPKLREHLIEKIKKTDIPFLIESDLQKNAKKRMQYYHGNGVERSVSAFINCGGSYANMGTSGLVLKVKPGLNTTFEFPSIEERGIIFHMAAQHIPVIHLLYIKGLVLKYGLPWDPIPLQKPGEAELYLNNREFSLHFWIVSILYVLFLGTLYIMYDKKKLNFSRTK